MRAQTLARTLLAATALAGTAFAVQAQTTGSRPVVQPLPPPAAGDLNAALRRLASNPRDTDALLSAGFASLQLNDIEAAVGFFGRAQDLQPTNARVKMGLAAAYVRSERPVEALQLFAEAEQAGANSQSVAGDRGLAFDLVGDNAAAQEQYARVLNGPDGDEIRRRLALSQAIQGNRQAFEATLYPLLERQDFAAYRTRAFALAILGEEKEAVAITEAVMPAELAARISPYLAYMRRLTPAQQAAAANLGMFPRAAQIGRDDPRVAAYSGRTAGVRMADAALAPSGTPLGATATPREDTSAQRRRPGRGSSRVDEPRTNARAQEPTPPVRVAIVQPTPTPTSTGGELPPVSTAVVQSVPPPPPPPPSPPPPPPSPPPPPTVTPVQPQPSAQSGFDLGSASGSVAAPAITLPVSAPPPPPPPPTPPPAASSVADAFAGFALAPATQTAARAPGAVDITSIKPPREVEKKPEAKPAPPPPPPPPKHPSRHWVQVATGRDKAALRFDWRRFEREAPAVLGKLEPHVTAWGQANRLLAGPYDSPKAARDAVAALKKEGLDAFTFTSDEGQEIARLR